MYTPLFQPGESWLVLVVVLSVSMGGLVVHLVAVRQADLLWMMVIRFLIGFGLAAALARLVQGAQKE